MNSPRITIILPLLFVFSASVQAGAAQTAAPIEVPEIDLSADPVAQAAKKHDSGQVSVVADPAALEAPSGPAAALDSEPAVQVRETGVAGQSVSVSVRGSDPRSTLISLDGIPLNSPFMGGADLNSLGLLTLDSISTVRGGQGSLRGDGAAGGTVDADTPSVLDEGGFTRAGVTAGSCATARLKVAHAHVFEKTPVGIMATAGFLHSGGEFRFTDSNGVSRDRTHNGTTAFETMAKVESEPAADHRLGGMVEFYRADRQVAGMEQFPSTTAGQADTRALAGINWTGPRLFGKWGNTSAQAWYRFLMFHYADSSPQMGPPVDTTMLSNSLGVSARALAAPWDRFGFRLGVEGGFQTGRVARAGQAGYQPDRGNFAGTVGFVAGSPTDPWQVAAEVRLEYNSGHGFTAVPGLGAWYEPHRLVRLSANVGRSYRLPTLEELYFDSGYVQGNRELDPEDSVAWDAGIELGHGRWWNFRAAYFENYGFNMIMFAPVSAFVIRAANSGAATIRGVEASGSVEWKWLEARAAYTWLYSRLDETGTRMPARPEHVVSGSVAVRGGPFRLAVMPSWQSGFYLDTFESLSEEGRFRLDLRLEVRPKPFVALVVDFLNVTDKRDAVDFVQQPLPGFSAFGSVRIDL